MRRALVLLILLAPLPTVAGEGTLTAVSPAVDLGTLEPDAVATFPVRLRNDHDRPLALDVRFVIRRSHDPDAASWIGVDSDQITLAPHAEEEVQAEVRIGSHAHSGDYLAHVIAREAFADGQAAAARKGVTVPVSFVVAGLDAWGRLNLPPVAARDQVLTAAATTLINHRATTTTAQAMVEIVRGAEVVHSWRSEPVALAPGAQHVQALVVDTHGLRAGPYQVRVFSAYDADGTPRRGVAIPHGMWVGPIVLAAQAFHLQSGSSAADLPDGSTMRVAPGVPVTGDVRVLNEAPAPAPGPFQVRLGDQEWAVAAPQALGPGATTLALPPLTAPATPGSYPLDLLQWIDDGWHVIGRTTLEVTVPRVELSDVVLTNTRLTAQAVSPDLDLDALLTLHVRGRSGLLLWSTTEHVWLPHGRPAAIDVPVEPALAPGAYELEWELGSGDLVVQGRPRIATAAPFPWPFVFSTLGGAGLTGLGVLLVRQAHRVGRDVTVLPRVPGFFESARAAAGHRLVSGPALAPRPFASLPQAPLEATPMAAPAPPDAPAPASAPEVPPELASALEDLLGALADLRGTRDART